MVIRIDDHDPHIPAAAMERFDTYSLTFTMVLGLDYGDDRQEAIDAMAARARYVTECAMKGLIYRGIDDVRRKE